MGGILSIKSITLKNLPFFLLIIFALGMGLLVASSCYTFFIVLNNTEKFYAMVIVFSIARLSERERETFQLLLEGFTLKECAKQMGIKYPTVNT